MYGVRACVCVCVRACVGLAQYSGDPRIEWHLNTHRTKESVIDAVKNLPYKGGNTLTGAQTSSQITETHKYSHTHSCRICCQVHITHTTFIETLMIFIDNVILNVHVSLTHPHTHLRLYVSRSCFDVYFGEQL